MTPDEINIQLKRKLIMDFLSSLDINKNNVSIKTLKEGLQAILQETPGLQINWRKEDILNETTNKKDAIESIESIVIAFTIDSGDKAHGILPKVTSLTFELE